MAMGNSRRISLVALFTAIAVVLNSLTVPAPYAGFLLYGVWEIPVLLALLVLGLWGGVSVAGLNALVLEFVNPGGLPTGPLYNFVAEVSMFMGVMALLRVERGRGWGQVAVVAAATLLGAAVRTLVMTLVNFLVLPQPYPIGFGVPEASVPWLLVLIGAFNLTTALYVVPSAFSVRRAISSRYRYFEGAGRQTFTQ